MTEEMKSTGVAVVRGDGLTGVWVGLIAGVVLGELAGAPAWVVGVVAGAAAGIVVGLRWFAGVAGAIGGGRS